MRHPCALAVRIALLFVTYGLVALASIADDDCNENGIPDECDIDCGAPAGPCDMPDCGLSVDCNGNGIPDECDIASGFSADCQPDGIPDECQLSAPVDLEAGLIGYWPCDEGEGTDVHDVSGNGHHGEILGGATWVDGVSGGGLLLDGSNDCVKVPDHTDLDLLESFSICAWFYVTEHRGAHIVSRNAAGANYQYTLGTGSPDLAVLYGATYNSDQGTAVFSETGVLPLEAWCFGVYVYDGTEIGLYYYNGSEIAAVDSALLGVTPPSINADLYFGTRRTSSGWFAGRIDEVRVYDRPLTEAEISYLAGLPISMDVNENSVPDECEDCNTNGLPDECDVDCGGYGAPCYVPGCGESADCNENGVPDECDIDPTDPDGDGDVSDDEDADGIPDECQNCVWGWQSLETGVAGAANALSMYSGDLIAGGAFTTAGGLTCNRIARWDGLVWSPLDTGLSETVAALTVFDGELIAGGHFSLAGDVECNRIARWNGSKWQPLGGGTTGQWVTALTVYNGDLIVGGDFPSAGGVECNHVARWDGSEWHALAGGIDGSIKALAVYGGELIAGGYFSTAGGEICNYVARWDGSDWHQMVHPGKVG